MITLMVAAHEPVARAHPAPLIISCGCWWQDTTRVRICPAHNRR